MPQNLGNMLAGDNTVVAAWSTFSDPQLIGVLARSSFDALVLDMQHGFHDERSVLGGIREIVAAGKAPLVRVPVDGWELVERVLDFGALGVIAPMVNNKKEAQRFAQAMNYPPIGSRSYSPRYAADIHGETVERYLTHASNELFGLAMIETREAYENIDEILEVEGIRGVLLGPADFSISVRQNPIPDPYGPDTRDLVADIADKARKAGKVAAAFTDRPAHANMVHEMGFRLISIALDSMIVANGIAACRDGINFAGE